MKKVTRKPAADRVLYERQAVLCKAFANPTRMHLLDLLGRGEAGASDLQERLGISKANLSQHLSILRSAGVVNTRRDGKRLLCVLSSREIKDACLQMRNILKMQGRNHRGI
ncbi:MAG TPA: metalloregulator ArsR/SmtB family transcription factor [Candidatus Koribacter sp.]|jgi:ArsR family transcriptional regulator